MTDDTISRAAAVDAMMNLQTEDIETYGASIPEGFDGDRAAKALKALPPAQPEPIAIRVDHELSKEEYERLKRDMQEQPVIILPKESAQPGWIPCSERLPKKSGQYYVSGGDKVWICEFLIIPNFIGGWCNDAANTVVQAWMPPPKPWKGEKP